MVGAASELFTQLLHDFIYVLFCKVRGAQNNGLPVGTHGETHQLSYHRCQRHRRVRIGRERGTHSLEFECLSQFGGVAGVDLEDAAERVRMAPVCKLCVGKDAKHHH